MYWADEMVPKRENGQAANRRLTRYIMLAHYFIYHHISRNVHSACPCRCNTRPSYCEVYPHIRAIILSLRPVSYLPEHTPDPFKNIYLKHNEIVTRKIVSDFKSNITLNSETERPRVPASPALLHCGS